MDPEETLPTVPGAQRAVVPGPFGWSTEACMPARISSTGRSRHCAVLLLLGSDECEPLVLVSCMAETLSEFGPRTFAGAE
jgi:hypothetical protein